MCFSLTRSLRVIILIGRDTKTDKRREGMAMNVEIKGNKLIIEIDLESQNRLHRVNPWL